jgi:hypothetical protein
MRNLKVFLALGAGLAAAVVAACSSSSSPATTGGNDAGGEDGSVGDDGSSAATCIPTSASGLCPSKTDTCCLDLSAGLAPGVCEAPSACSANIQIQCDSAATCSAGQVCCADLGGLDAGLIAAFEDGGAGALGIDAAALMSEAGAASLLSSLGSIMFKVSCAASCTPTQIQACASTAECTGGATCEPLSQLFPADAGIDAGGAAAGLGSQISLLGMNMACVPPASDGGTAPVADGGTDSGTTDSGSTVTDAATEAAP